MKEKYDKHPINFDDYSPKEFAKKFVKTNYFYQQECFKELISEYQKEAEGDKNRASIKDPSKRRVQLYSGLEKVIKSISGPVLEGFKEISSACKNYMQNPFE